MKENMYLLFHKWEKVSEDNHKFCGQCFKFYGGCSHSIKVCVKCGEFIGYGSHGKLSVIPDGCKEEVAYLRK